MSDQVVTIEDVRMYMRDFEARNDLLERLEFKDEEVERAIDLSVSKFNSMTPLTYFTPSGFPVPFKFVALAGAASILLNSEAMAQVRNELQYSDGGVSVNVDGKGQTYKMLADSEAQKFEKYAEDIKRQLNAEAAFGGSFSGYSWLPSW